MSVGGVEVRIAELVLEGASRTEVLRVGDALERELTRLITQRGLPPVVRGGREVRSVDAASLDGSRGGGGAAFGANLAQAVYGALER